MTSNVEAVFAAATPEELAASYDRWAPSYETDLSNQGGPREAVDLLVKYVAPSARVLDAGCGTGVVGGLLAERGFQHLEGLDLSTGMLDEARKKQCYSALHQQALGETLDFPDATFDAVTVVGVFVMGHAPSRSLHELIRITKPGGYIIFTLRPELYANSDFKPTMAALEQDGRWRLAEASDAFHGRFKAHPEVMLQVWVYQTT
ncbi:MAG: class I SAM-dependent methyltransferase [Methylococcaceae bacterium]|nr:MAG: class I SAM-dependent methyltransferase [Methylococcaceae bacterium]